MQKRFGKVSLDLGAGRLKKEDNIDHLAGIVLEKKIGDKVEIGDILCYIHTNKEERIERAIEDLEGAYKISKSQEDEYKHILDII